jgi:hypothetical protein
MKLPKKYLTKNPNVMKREIRKHGEKKDSDSSAYGPWDADYKSRKAGKGKPVETKPSKYTQKYKKMFGEGLENRRILDFDSFISEGINESEKSKRGPVDKALRKKAKKSGMPLGILRQVWNRGYAAWKTGHVPGTTPQQWAMARVNSFIVGGKTTKMSDKALYKRAKKQKTNESKLPDPTSSTYVKRPIIDPLKIINPSNKYKCLPDGYGFIADRLIKRGYDKTFLKAAFSVMGRESSYGSGLRYNITNPVKRLASFFGSKTSIGPAQMKLDTARGLGVEEDSITSVQGAVTAVYKYIDRSYKIAKQNGYTSSPSSNFKYGTGDAALDISIASYNLGIQKITKYCETSDPKVKKSCKLAGRKIDGILVSNKNIVNYLPNFKTERWDKVEITTHGYVKEVAERMKKMNCF